MKLTDIFIRRPVLASVVSLLILLFGLSALQQISIRQFPRMNNTILTVSTAYPGADAALISGFITGPLEAAIASAEGIDYMLSSSTQGQSSITLSLKLNFDPQVAFTDVMSKVQQVLNQLPPEAQQPVILKKSDTSTPLMYISLSSQAMNPQQITDYATRVVKPQLETVEGIASAELLGGKKYALRAFLNPIKMAALHVTPAEVFQVMANNNYLTAAGSTKNEYVALKVHAQTNLNALKEFSRLIVRSDTNRIVRLQDIANVKLGAENYDESVRFDGKKAVFIALTPTPTANPLTVIHEARQAFEHLTHQFPPSLKGKVVYDATDFIRASIKEVIKTIIEAAVIVIIVIFLFLGSLRAVLIPVLTIPLSLVGVCFFMLVLGYSINLLTLLAFVLAIGLVVDDAIVVVENIHRHIEEGLTPFSAAIQGAREIALPIIAMTITLAAVYAPIGFMQGLTGALFKEFAFTLAGAVIISGIIALTLSPMMCAKLLTTENHSSALTQWLDTRFEQLKIRYKSLLKTLLDDRKPTTITAIAILLFLPYLYVHTAKETAPEEDQGFFFVVSQTPSYATLKYVERYTALLDNIYQGLPEAEHSFILNSATPGSGVVLKPWGTRPNQLKMKKTFQQQLDQIPGLKSFAVIPPPLPGGGTGTPVQFVIKTTNDYRSLFDVTEQLLAKARQSGLFIYIDNSLKFNQPQLDIAINRSKAADMGLDMKLIGSNITSALSGAYVNFFDLKGRSYKVIPQLAQRFRSTPTQLGQIYLKTTQGAMVSLATFASPTLKVQPNMESHFQQLNSATLNAVPMPGITLGESIQFLQKIATDVLPQGFSVDYAGQSRQFIQESNALLWAFFLAVLVIFLVLAAQYESFRDPLIILISVPMSIAGALLPLNLGLASINIYTQVGLITLIGLISKHGILMVDFANHLQRQHHWDKKTAIAEAASIRLRPILMTTAAMVFGVFPLLIAGGAGAVSRFDIGLVIASGLLIGTCFTLLIVPTMYTYFAADHRSPKDTQTGA